MDTCVQRCYKVWQTVVRVLHPMLLFGLKRKKWSHLTVNTSLLWTPRYWPKFKQIVRNILYKLSLLLTPPLWTEEMEVRRLTTLTREKKLSLNLPRVSSPRKRLPSSVVFKHMDTLHSYLCFSRLCHLKHEYTCCFKPQKEARWCGNRKHIAFLPSFHNCCLRQ